MPAITTTNYTFPCLFSKRNPGTSQKNVRTEKGEPFPKKKTLANKIGMDNRLFSPGRI
jgi:hypothetical protein